MTEPPKQLQWIVWGGIAATVVALSGALFYTKLTTPKINLPWNFPLPAFVLTNQHSEPVTLASLKGRVWVADIIFTRCGGPCPRMTHDMSELEKVLPKDPRVGLLTLTTDPDHDTPAVLKQYARDIGASSDRWVFLTGTKQEIGKLAIDGLQLAAHEKDASQRENDKDLFVHSTLFVVVDKFGRLRASYESDDPGTHEKIGLAVRKLLKERRPR